MPQLIQGPTLADVATNVARREKEIKSRGKISARGAAELRKLKATGDLTGATAKDRARQRAIFKEMQAMVTGKKKLNAKRYNRLFRESDRIAGRARKAAEAKKAAKKAAKKVAKKARPAKKAAKKVAKKARPVKKVAKKAAKARPVKKAAKKATRRSR